MKKITLYALIMFVTTLISCRKKGNEPIPVSPNPQPVIETPLPPVAMASDKKNDISVKPRTDTLEIRTDEGGKKNEGEVLNK